MSKQLQLKSIVWKEEKYFVAQCLQVDISSFGKTKNEAIQNLDEALELYFEDVKKPRIQQIRNPEIVRISVGHA